MNLVLIVVLSQLFEPLPTALTLLLFFATFWAGVYSVSQYRRH